MNKITDNLHYQALALFLLLAALATVPFWLTDWDIQLAQLFYYPNRENPWPVGDEPLWRFFYYLGPMISMVVALGSLLVLAWGFVAVSKRGWRMGAIYVLLTFVLGPGLLVNGVFKEHWGRPRPLQVTELGGMESYVPPLEYNAHGDGKSFPSGHSSVGFAMLAFWLLWRRKYPRAAPYLFWGSLAFGGLLGITRMAAGGHFLSDVLWSALISGGVAWVLYFWVLRMPEYETEHRLTLPRWLLGLYVALGAALVVWSLFAVPVEANVNQQYQLSNPSQQWELLLDDSDVQISVSDQLAPNTWTFWHESRGFGLVGSKVRLIEQISPNSKQLHLAKQGMFTELVGSSKIQIAAQFTLPLRIEVKRGKVLLPSGGLPTAVQVEGH